MVVSYLLHKHGNMVPGLRKWKMQNNKKTRSPWCFACLGRKLNHKTEQGANNGGGSGQEEQNADFCKGRMMQSWVRSVSLLISWSPTACHQFMSSTPAVYLASVQLRPLLAVGPDEEKGPFLGGVPCGRGWGRLMGSPTQVLGLQPVHCLKVTVDMSVVPIRRAYHMHSSWLSGTCITKKKVICPEQTEAMQGSCRWSCNSSSAELGPGSSWQAHLRAAHGEHCRSVMKAWNKLYEANSQKGNCSGANRIRRAE